MSYLLFTIIAVGFELILGLVVKEECRGQMIYIVLAFFPNIQAESPILNAYSFLVMFEHFVNL